MTTFRNLLAKSAFAALLVFGAAHVAHADISSFSATIGGPSGNGPGNGNNGTESAGTSSNDGGGHGLDAFAYESKSPNTPKLPRLPKPKPCRGTSCKVQTVSADGQVCFYTGANFTGAHFCASIGTSAPRLPARWNDRIASIEVIGPVSAKVCSDRAYSGQCLVLDSSRAALFTLDGEISSYAVRR